MAFNAGVITVHNQCNQSVELTRQSCSDDCTARLEVAPGDSGELIATSSFDGDETIDYAYAFEGADAGPLEWQRGAGAEWIEDNLIDGSPASVGNSQGRIVAEHDSNPCPSYFPAPAEDSSGESDGCSLVTVGRYRNDTAIPWMFALLAFLPFVRRECSTVRGSSS
jgi:hypothetical protein